MPELSQATATFKLSPKATAAEIKSLLLPFAIDPREREALRQSFNTPIGNWELAAADRCYKSSQAFKAHPQEVEEAILKKYDAPGKLLDDLIGAREGRGSSTFEEAYTHFAFERSQMLSDSPAPQVPEYAAAADRGRELLKSLCEMDKALHSPYVRMASLARLAAALSALGITANDLFIEKEAPEFRAQVIRGGVRSKETQPARKYMALAPERLKELQAYANREHSLELEPNGLYMSLMYLKGTDLSSLPRLVTDFAAGLDKGGTEAAALLEDLRKLLPFPATKKGLEAVDAIRKSLCGTVYSVSSESIQSMKKIGQQLGFGVQLAENAERLAARLAEAHSLLMEEHRRIIHEQAKSAFDELFGNCTSAIPGAYQALLKSGVKLAGKRIRDYHGTTFEFYRSQIFEQLAKDGEFRTANPHTANLMRGLKLPEDNFHLPEFDVDDSNFWSAVAVHAAGIAITSAVTRELMDMQERELMQERAASTPVAD